MDGEETEESSDPNHVESSVLVRGEEESEEGMAGTRDETFLLMQEAIVEDPREDYEALLPPPCVPSAPHHRLFRHHTWTAPGRVSPEPIDQAPIVAQTDFPEHFQYLVMSLRQSEASQKLLQRLMPQYAQQRHSFTTQSDKDKGDLSEHPSRSASFSVDQSRRTLLAVLEGRPCGDELRGDIAGPKTTS